MAGELLRFGDFELDRNAYQLRRGGRVVRLERIPLELLFLLAGRRGQLVSREEILERVWGKGVFIDIDASINAAVRKARRALQDDAEAPRFLVTVPTKGYRFVAPVRDGDHDPSKVRPAQGSFVGRKRELAELRGGLEDAVSGRGNLFLISGPPGVGKTRMTAELATLAQVQGGGMAVLSGHCSAQEGAVPYLPFVEILETCVDQCANPDRVRSLVGKEGPELGRLAPKLKRILPDLPAPMELPAAQARRHLFNCFCDFAARLAGSAPLLMVLDDLHWADDSTLALLGHLVRRLADLPLLVVGTYRDVDLDIGPALAGALENLLRGRAISVRLKGLVRDEVALLLEHLSGQEPPPAVVSEIDAETAGNPFFVEELFRYLEEEDRLYDAAGGFRSDLKVSEQEVPQNVRLVVGRRLARLTDLTQKILGTAAAIGRSFPLKVLEAAAAADRLVECVEEAEKAGLLLSVRQSLETRFEFSHELVRQVVINGQSAPRRQRLHLEVAGAIERVYADAREEHCAELAHHYERGGDARQAVEYLGRAGSRAAYQLAHSDAIGYWTRALELLNLLPESPERDRRELDLRRSVVWMHFLSNGNAATETIEAVERAAALAEKSGNLAQLVDWMCTRAAVAHESGDFPAAGALADLTLELALRDGNPITIAAVHMVQIWVRNCLGDLAGTEKHFAAARPFFDDPGIRQTPGMLISALYFASLNAWMLGRAEVARERTELLIATADQSNPYSLTFSRSCAALLRAHFREYEQAEELAAQGLELAEKYQFQFAAAASRGVLGLARAHLGRGAEGVALLRNAVAGFIEVRAGAAVSGFTVFLAAAQEREGAVGDALGTVEQVLRANPEQIEALKLRGELRLKQGRMEAAEADFRQVITLAQRIGAKAWELRATTSLADMLARHGRRDEARAMLAEIYGWFTEGFDTADLKDANALLDELSQ